MYTKKTIEEMNALSTAVFGSKSKWQKMINLGVGELVEEDTVRLHPDGTREMIKTPKMHVGKNEGELHQYNLKRYTVDSVKEFMLNVLTQRALKLEALKKQQEEQKANAIQEASGSSI